MTTTGGPRIDRHADTDAARQAHAGRPADAAGQAKAAGRADTTRQADVALLRSALSDLAGESRVAGESRLAGESGQAGESGLARDDVPRPRTVNQPECRATRAAMHDYVKGRLMPSRQRRVEAHLDRCGQCTRAFIDVREVSWELRGLGRRLAADGHPGGRHRRVSRRSRI